MAEALLITRQDVVKFTAMNGNVDTDNFIQYVKIAQDIHIQNYLGTDLLEKSTFWTAVKLPAKAICYDLEG